MPILAHSNRLEDVVAGLSLQNQMLSSELQSARARNSQLVSDEEEKQELLKSLEFKKVIVRMISMKKCKKIN